MPLLGIISLFFIALLTIVGGFSIHTSRYTPTHRTETVSQQTEDPQLYRIAQINRDQRPSEQKNIAYHVDAADMKAPAKIELNSTVLNNARTQLKKISAAHQTPSEQKIDAVEIKAATTKEITSDIEDLKRSVQNAWEQREARRAAAQLRQEKDYSFMTNAYEEKRTILPSHLPEQSLRRYRRFADPITQISSTDKHQTTIYTFCPQYPAETEHILLYHGTGATPDRWGGGYPKDWKQCDAVPALILMDAQYRALKDNKKVVLHILRWSGDVTENSRTDAAALTTDYIVKAIADEKTKYPDRKISITQIAHSFGCHVANHTANNLAKYGLTIDDAVFIASPEFCTKISNIKNLIHIIGKLDGIARAGSALISSSPNMNVVLEDKHVQSGVEYQHIDLQIAGTDLNHKTIKSNTMQFLPLIREELKKFNHKQRLLIDIYSKDISRNQELEALYAAENDIQDDDDDGEIVKASEIRVDKMIAEGIIHPEDNIVDEDEEDKVSILSRTHQQNYARRYPTRPNPFKERTAQEICKSEGDATGIPFAGPLASFVGGVLTATSIVKDVVTNATNSLRQPPPDNPCISKAHDIYNTTTTQIDTHSTMNHNMTFYTAIHEIDTLQQQLHSGDNDHIIDAVKKIKQSLQNKYPHLETWRYKFAFIKDEVTSQDSHDLAPEEKDGLVQARKILKTIQRYQGSDPQELLSRSDSLESDIQTLLHLALEDKQPEQDQKKSELKDISSGWFYLPTIWNRQRQQ